MRRILITAAAASLLAVTATAAQAQPRPERNTTGECVSEGFYGNEPNIVGPFAPGGPQEQAPGSAAGRVVPSQSPGPFVNTGPNEPPRNDRTRGGSVGDFNQQARDAGYRNSVQAVCKPLEAPPPGRD